MRRAAVLSALVLAGCGVKGPPRPPGVADAPEEAPCEECLVTEPQPGLESAPGPAPATDDDAAPAGMEP